LEELTALPHTDPLVRFRKKGKEKWKLGEGKGRGER